MYCRASRATSDTFGLGLAERHAQLTKRAPLGRDSETRTTKGRGEAASASCREAWQVGESRCPAVLAIFTKPLPPRC
jgi:hypothetical protein